MKIKWPTGTKLTAKCEIYSVCIFL